MIVLPIYMLVNTMWGEGRSLRPWSASALCLASTIREVFLQNYASSSKQMMIEKPQIAIMLLAIWLTPRSIALAPPRLLLPDFTLPIILTRLLPFFLLKEVRNNSQTLRVFLQWETRGWKFLPGGSKTQGYAELNLFR
jgi:hypothetical protein